METQNGNPGWNNYKTKPENFSLPEGRTQDCIGTPDYVRNRLREFEESGVDQVIFLSQAGRIPHDTLCSSIELFGKEVLPEVKARDERDAGRKAELKQRIAERAMKRKREAAIPDRGPTVIRAAGHH
jgi:hypothetical protein